MTELREAANHILLSAIEAVKPDQLIRQKIGLQNDILKIEDQQFKLNEYNRIYIIGAGKASAEMAREMENMLGEGIFYGVISVKYGHSRACRKLRILEAGHPVVILVLREGVVQVQGAQVLFSPTSEGAVTLARGLDVDDREFAHPVHVGHAKSQRLGRLGP